MKWSIIVHPNAIEEINNLPMDMRAKLTRLIEIIEQLGPLALREPHVKSLGNKLWELRLRGRDGISRVVYILLRKNTVGLLHAFIKKTPQTAINCALRRSKELDTYE